MTEPDAQQAIHEVLQRELQKQAVTFQQLKGGRNSQVFRVDCADGSKFAAKAYFQSANDKRDRIGNEFRAFQFLKERGLSQIPEPLAADFPRRIGIYEYIDGDTLRNADRDDIDQAVGFLRALRILSRSPDAAQADFPPASEACFSIDAISASLEGRFQRLARAAESHPDLAAFLQNDLAPFRATADAWSREQGVDPAAEIPVSDRTLSPSDFGFHNALRSHRDSLVFLDFEYFGWDDPAKTVSDFLLHPAMELSPALRAHFLSTALSAFDIPSLADRVRAVYPLFGLKWCAILLNEFTLEHMERRCFADNAPGVWNGVAQLEKARRMLAGVLHDYRHLHNPAR